jgi:hypothetical protein
MFSLEEDTDKKKLCYLDPIDIISAGSTNTEYNNIYKNNKSRSRAQF